jgi:predicted metal-binding membrane protein
MWRAQSDQRIFAAVFALLIAGAWLALVVWGASPFGYMLDHRAMGESALHLDGAYLRTLAVFVAGWSLMTVAMMLPTTFPLLLIFRNMTRNHQRRLWLLLVLVLGYLVVWSAFGAAAHFFDFFVHKAVEASPRLHANEWVLGAGPLLVAGVYQFTPLKHLCLDKCRSPFSFVAVRWHGEKAARCAFRIGIDHGIFCLGCCWSLMLLMFAVSIGNFAWMLVLAAVMGIEKNFAWGRGLSTPLGVVLLSAGMTICLRNLI